MTQDVHDLDNWIAALKGKEGVHDPVASALGDVIREKVVVTDDEIRAAQPLAEKRLLKRLKDEKLIDQKKNSKKYWPLAPIAIATSLAIAVYVNMQVPSMSKPTGNYYQVSSEITLQKSISTLRLAGQELQKKADEIIKQLDVIGLSATQERTSEGIELTVEVSSEKLKLFSYWYTDLGGNATEPGRYSILVVPQ